jgi:hypothetical protein
VLSDRDLGWLAGFIEGEGSFAWNKNPRRGGGCLVVTADQKQRLPLDKIVLLLGGTIYLRTDKDRNIFVWQIRGEHAARVMMTLYGLMSPRRRMQIAKALSEWRKVRPWKYLRSCKYGHPYPENVVIWKDGRKRCIMCQRDRKKKIRVFTLPPADFDVRAAVETIALPVTP